MKIGSIPAASTATIKSTFVPEILILKTAVLTNVDSCKVNVYGEGIILDLPNAGLAALDAMGQVAEDTTSYVIPLANGKWVKKDCEITITNLAAAATVEVYGFGTHIGTHFIKSVAESYLAYNPIVLEKFLFASFPAIAATDQITVTWNVADEDGIIRGTFQEQMLRDDVLAISGASQGKTGYHFNNLNQMYKTVNIQITANSVIYYSRIIEAQSSK